MAAKIVKSDLAGAINEWLDEALKSGTAHKLSVHEKSGYVTLRSGATEWDVELDDAAGLVATKLYDLRQAKDGRIQDKSYSANKYYLKLAGVTPATFGADEKPIQEREYTPRTTSGGATVSTGKSAVAKIDSQIANLQERQAKLEVTLTETKAAIKKLQDEREIAVKAEADAQAAKAAAKKAEEEELARALTDIMGMDDTDIAGKMADMKAQIALLQKALAAKKASVTA